MKTPLGWPMTRAVMSASLAIVLAMAPIGLSGLQSPGVGSSANNIQDAGAISGVVTDAATHRPIAGARVMMGKIPGPPGPLSSCVTDAKGRFVFVRVPAGTYRPYAEKSGFADGGFGRDIPLAAGQWFSAANIEIIKLGVVTGIVTDERNEPVVGAYVRVLMPFLLAGARQIAAGPVATTDDQGAYRIVGLPQGKYYVVVPSVQHSLPASSSFAPDETSGASRPPASSLVSRSVVTTGALVQNLTALILGNYVTPPAPIDGRLRAYPITFFPGVSSFVAASAVDLAYGEEKQGVDIRLEPAATATVSGKLADWNADSGALTLRLVPAGLENLGAGSEAATTLVDRDGTFVFVNVPAGRYTITPSFFEFSVTPVANRYDAGALHRPAGLGLLPETPGLSPGESRGLSVIPAAGLTSSAAKIGYSTYTQDASSGAHVYGQLPITVGGDDISDLVVPRQASSTLRLTVACDDVKGAPPAGGLILASADGNDHMVPPHSVFQSSSDWAATTHRPKEITGVLAGEYVVTSTMPGLSIKSVMVGAEDDSRRALRVNAGEASDVLVTFTGKTITLSGVVKDASGAPVPLASVVAFPVERQLWAHQGLTQPWIRASVTSEAGAFKLSDLRAGEYYVVGVPAGMRQPWRDPAFLESAEPFAARVNLDWGDAKRIDVKVSVSK